MSCTLANHIQAAKDENNINFINDWFGCVAVPYSKVDVDELIARFDMGDWIGVEEICLEAKRLHSKHKPCGLTHRCVCGDNVHAHNSAGGACYKCDCKKFNPPRAV